MQLQYSIRACTETANNAIWEKVQQKIVEMTDKHPRESGFRGDGYIRVPLWFTGCDCKMAMTKFSAQSKDSASLEASNFHSVLDLLQATLNAHAGFALLDGSVLSSETNTICAYVNFVAWAYLQLHHDANAQQQIINIKQSL